MRLLRAQLRALWLWVRRRRDGVGPGDVALPYAREQVPTMLLLAVVFGVETVVVGLLVPWWWIHVLDVLAIVQVLAFAAVAVTRPHVVTSDRLKLREGGQFELDIPLTSISEVRTERGFYEKSGLLLENGEFNLVTGHQTDVLVRLEEPVESPRGEVHTVRFRADEPGQAVSAIRRALSAVQQPDPAGQLQREA